MKKILALLFNRWTLALLILLALALLIWFGGPLLGLGDAHPLDPESHRWIAIGVLTLLSFGLMAWRSFKARRGNQAVVAQLLAPPSGPATPAESADMQAVRERFEQALQQLRELRFGESGGVLSGWQARLNGRHLYELPWYLIIGAPGSGKTTALLNSELHFPLADLNKGSGAAISGVGGTRHCDWWFTDQAVLIDTAGRFTTQDSDRDNDRATWAGFLAMLKQSRPRQPLNGVLVTVSVSDLLTRSAAERQQYAATVRQRVQELHEQLGIRLPIYLLVSKADLLAGFADYFATLDKAQRADPWGLTFDLDAQQRSDTGSFGAHFDALVQRIDAGLIERLQSERDVQRRTRIYGFPAQLAGLREPLQEFIAAVFSPSRFEAQPLLRGVYLISGTQEGSPIDRLLGSVARQFRLERAILPPQQSSGRSYFLNRLLSQVVFAESALAGTHLGWEKRRQRLTLAAYAGLAVISLVFVTLSVLSYRHNRDYVSGVAGQATQLQQRLQTDPARANTDLLALLPLLERTRQVAMLDPAPASPLGWGLNQSAKLDAAAGLAYQRMLIDALLPRLALRIETQLRDNSLNDEQLYDTLRSYLMLHQPEHLDAAALKAYLERDWDSQYARSLSPEQRSALSLHLQALLQLGALASPLPPDEALIGTARQRLAAVSLPQRIYNHMRRQGLGAEFPEISVSASAGKYAELVFTRASNEPLNRGVAGLYSFEGYQRGFQRQVSQSSKTLAEEQPWVLGSAAGSSNLSPAQLSDEVLRLYLTDYARTWEAYIADVKLKPITSIPQAIEMVRALSGPDSPLPPLLKTFARHTTLAAPLDQKGLAQQAEGKVNAAIGEVRDKLADLRGQPTAAAAGPRIEQRLVDDRFTALRQYVSAPEGGKPPIDGTIALLAEAYNFLNAVETAIRSRMPVPASDVPNRLKSEGGRLPSPARELVETVASSSAHAASLTIRDQLAKEVRSSIGEFCGQAINGRYPFDRRSARDVTPADFASLFGPGGKIDSFVQTKLQPYVDTSVKPWRFLDRDGSGLGNDPGTLPQFQRAQAIRDAFFPSGNQPVLRLEIKPVEMDSAISQLVIDIDGQVVRYNHGPQIPTSVQWPGPRGSNQIRLQVTPSSNTAGQLIEGPWALLRLFDGRRIEVGKAPERFSSVFEFEGRKATFEITASSVRNPFTMRELSEFACPNGL